MSWLTLDDGILDHPKFVRAVRLGGSETVHMWLGLRAYCGKRLSDGAIPLDMLDEVRGPKSEQKRARAIEVLRTVGLLDDGDNCLIMHDFADWSETKSEVESRRSGWRKRQQSARDSREESRRDTKRDTKLESREESFTSRARPSPPLPDPYPNPEGETRVAARRRLPATKALPSELKSRSAPADWQPMPEPELDGEARAYGIDLAVELAKMRDHEYRVPKSAWQKSWRTWLRKSIEYAKERGAKRVNPASNAPNPEAVRRNAEREARDIAEQNAHARAELKRLGIDPSDPKIRQGLLSGIGGGG